MAGGVGTRLWPLSRRHRPKQSLELVGNATMFEQAVERVTPLFGLDRILVITAAEHVDLLAEQVPQLPKANFIVEPEGRGTAPCIGLAAIHLRRRDPDATMAVLTADHFIRDAARFREVLMAAEQVARDDYLVTLGITPTGPSTGYGYIQQGERIATCRGLDVFRTERFTEKPDYETAVRMVTSGRYSWNSGMFIWRLGRILDEIREQMPELYTTLGEIEPTLDTQEYEPVLTRCWPRVAKQTIDYGVMEKATHVAVVPADIGWCDIGSWASLAALLPSDEQGNVVRGEHVGIDTSHSFIWGDRRLIATIGLERIVVVDTEDALLICPLEREQEVREIAQRLGQDSSSVHWT